MKIESWHDFDYGLMLPVLVLLTISCNGFGGVFTDASVNAFKPGAVVQLAKAGGGKISGLMVDVNSDSVPDGIDLNNDGIPEMVFKDLVVGKSGGVDVNGDGVVDYYISADYLGNFYLNTTNPNGNTNSGNVTVTTDANGTPTGFNNSGGTTVDNDILRQIYTDTTSPTVAVNPAGGTFVPAQTVIVSCTDNVACNAISYTTDGSTPSFSGNGIMVLGNTATLAVGSSVMFKYVARDAKGNLSTVGNVWFTIYAGMGVPQWARSVTAGTNVSVFYSTTTDSSGNVYAAGEQHGITSYTYGAGVSATGTYSSGNAVLVKYDSSGTAIWARSVTAGTNASRFQAVTTDSSGNVYAAGWQTNAGSYTYGPGVSITGTAAGSNVVLVKYDSSGAAVWARTITAGVGNGGLFAAVTTDSAGNVYTAGKQYGTTTLTYGVGVSATGSEASGWNVVLVKYDSSGTASWARSVTAGAGDTSFSGIAVDSSGNIYAAGAQYGTGTHTYGPSVNSTGTYTGNNVLLVKYDTSGAAIWARSVTAGPSTSVYNAVTHDNSGNIYAAGYQNGTGGYTFGPGVSITGTAPAATNVVLVKYDAAGTAQWARSVTAGTANSYFNAVTADDLGNIFVAGKMVNTVTDEVIGYGSGVNVLLPVSGWHVALLKYNSAGTALWARSVTGGSANSSFEAVTVRKSGNIYNVYATGFQGGTSTYTYGPSLSSTGTHTGGNAMIVKYAE